jgi:hypothetical protein
MDEGDLQAEEARSRRFVDQLGAAVGELSQCRGEVRDLIGDVMHAGAAFDEELANGRLLAERRHQLDPAFAKADRHRPHALILERTVVLDGRPEEPPVGPDSLVEVLHGHADVMDAQGLHGPDASCDRRVGALKTAASAEHGTALLVGADESAC